MKPGNSTDRQGEYLSQESGEMEDKQKEYLSQNYHKLNLANFRNVLRRMPGYEEEYEDWTKGDFTMGGNLNWLGIHGSKITPSPRHDPDLPKRPQYTVKFLRKHLPDPVFVDLMTGYRENLDHESDELKIPREQVERQAKKIDDILEDKLSRDSKLKGLKETLSKDRGKLQVPSNLSTLKDFLTISSEDSYQPPVDKASMIHRWIPDYRVSVQD